MGTVQYPSKEWEVHHWRLNSFMTRRQDMSWRIMRKNNSLVVLGYLWISTKLQASAYLAGFGVDLERQTGRQTGLDGQYMHWIHSCFVPKDTIWKAQHPLFHGDPKSSFSVGCLWIHVNSRKRLSTILGMVPPIYFIWIWVKVLVFTST